MKLADDFPVPPNMKAASRFLGKPGADTLGKAFFALTVFVYKAFHRTKTAQMSIAYEIEKHVSIAIQINRLELQIRSTHFVEYTALGGRFRLRAAEASFRVLAAALPAGARKLEI